MLHLEYGAAETEIRDLESMDNADSAFLFFVRDVKNKTAKRFLMAELGIGIEVDHRVQIFSWVRLGNESGKAQYNQWCCEMIDSPVADDHVPNNVDPL